LLKKCRDKKYKNIMIPLCITQYWVRKKILGEETSESVQCGKEMNTTTSGCCYNSISQKKGSAISPKINGWAPSWRRGQIALGGGVRETLKP
jgi:hypothetical protein